jgi:hypothetical protein
MSTALGCQMAHCTAHARLDRAQGRRALHAEQSAHVVIAAQQRHELLCVLHRVRDAQFGVGTVAAQVRREQRHRSAGAAVVEEAADVRETSILRDDDRMQAERLAREHGAQHAHAEKVQGAPRRQAFHCARHVGVHDGVAHFLNHAGEQLLLAAEVTVDRHLGGAGGRGDLVHARATKAAAEEDAAGSLQDRVPLGVAPVGAPGGSGCFGHAGRRFDRYCTV